MLNGLKIESKLSLKRAYQVRQVRSQKCSVPRKEEKATWIKYEQTQKQSRLSADEENMACSHASYPG